MIKIAVVGLGYVGLSLAVSLSRNFKVWAYDYSQTRIQALQKGYDKNNIVNTKDLKQKNLLFTQHLHEIKESNFIVVAVSTPALYYEFPDLDPLVDATKAVAEYLKKGDVVVFESTVYPGTTEEVCLPLMEEISGLRAGLDFFLAYSPERINVGDPKHTLKTIPKIVSAQTKEALTQVMHVYGTVCDSLYPVSNIKTAEAIKILENTQRDVNIAFMNEFAKITHALNIDLHEILEGAKTKWSFVPFKPGLVGGHCISVDPQYLAFKAKRLGVYPHIISAARHVNDGMTKFLIQEMNRLLIKHRLVSKEISIGLFGITFKENIPDVRNSLSLKLVNELKEYGFNLQVNDPQADREMVKRNYHIELLEFAKISNIQVALILVNHNEYLQAGFSEFLHKFKNTPVIMDVPNCFVAEGKREKSIIYWHL